MLGGFLVALDPQVQAGNEWDQRLALDAGSDGFLQAGHSKL